MLPELDVAQHQTDRNKSTEEQQLRLCFTFYLFQVIDGGQANDLRIDFRLIRPDGVPVVADFAKSDTAHRNAAELDGDYKICFDNTKAR